MCNCTYKIEDLARKLLTCPLGLKWSELPFYLKKKRIFVKSNREEMSNAEVQLISTNFDNETRKPSAMHRAFFWSVFFSFHKQKRTCFVLKKLKKPTYFFQRKKALFRCSFLNFSIFRKKHSKPLILLGFTSVVLIH